MGNKDFDKKLDDEKFLKTLFKDLDQIDAEVRDGSEGMGALAGGGIGAAGSLAALYGLGVTGLSGAGIMSGLAAAGAVVGGGAVAGIGVLAAPIAVLAVGGYALMNHKKQKEVRRLQGQVLAKAISKQNEITRRLGKKSELSSAAVAELEARLSLLNQIVDSLRRKQ